MALRFSSRLSPYPSRELAGQVAGGARALFYVATVGAALLAVLATGAPLSTYAALMNWSWYLLMAGLVLFAAMMVSQAAAAWWLPEGEDDAPDSVAQGTHRRQ